MLTPSNRNGHDSLYQWIVVRPEPTGQFTAQVVGIAELRATAASREEAIEQVRVRILEWIATGQLVPLELLPKEHPVLRFHGWADPNAPEEKLFLEELARLKAEDLERTLREYAEEDQQCSGSSSTPEELLRNWPGHDPADPLEQEFLADLERFRREDLEGLSREGSSQDQSCSNTSSTPTI
ncbi:MAG: hypothetical protein ACRELF_06905 [Gemmataceae bacterium]